MGAFLGPSWATVLVDPRGPSGAGAPDRDAGLGQRPLSFSVGSSAFHGPSLPRRPRTPLERTRAASCQRRTSAARAARGARAVGVERTVGAKSARRPAESDVDHSRRPDVLCVAGHRRPIGGVTDGAHTARLARGPCQIGQAVGGIVRSKALYIRSWQPAIHVGAGAPYPRATRRQPSARQPSRPSPGRPLGRSEGARTTHAPRRLRADRAKSARRSAESSPVA